MNKFLSYKNEPIIKTYPYYGNYLGVLEAHEYDVGTLLLKYFMKLTYIPITGQVNFRNKKKLKNLFNFESFNVSKSELLQFTRESISNDYYVVICLDDRCFNLNLSNYKKVHNWLVVGIDELNKKIKLIGYMIMHGCNTYQELYVSFDEYINAYSESVSYIQKRRISFNHRFKVTPETTKRINSCRFTKFNMIESLLYSYFINCAIYDFLGRHILFYSHLSFEPYKRGFLDMRDLRILYENSMVFNTFLSNYACHFEKEIKEICNANEQILMIAAKYNVRGEPGSKSKYAKKILPLLAKIRKKYRFIIKKILLNNYKNRGTKYEIC